MTASHLPQRAIRIGPLILVLFWVSLAPARGADGARLPNDPGLSAILAHGAWVQSVTAVCRNDAPEISGHLIQAYDDWRERNVVIRETLHASQFGPDVEQAAEARDIFERLKSRAESIYAEKREIDPEDFGRECDAFTKELAAGEWDYPKAKGLSR